MRIVAHCVSTVDKSSAVSADDLLSFWESGILVDVRLHGDPGSVWGAAWQTLHVLLLLEEFSLLLWTPCRRIGSLSLVSSGFFSACLFLCCFCFVSRSYCSFPCGQRSVNPIVPRSSSSYVTVDCVTSWSQACFPGASIAAFQGYAQVVGILEKMYGKYLPWQCVWKCLYFYHYAWMVVGASFLLEFWNYFFTVFKFPVFLLANWHWSFVSALPGWNLF